MVNVSFKKLCNSAAETAAHHADDEDETAMEGARDVPAPLPSQPTARELEAHLVVHTPCRAWCEACVRGRGRNAGHKQLAAKQDHVIDTVSVDYAFFGEHDLIANFVLILRGHKCRWTETLRVQSKGGQDVSVVKSVADMVRRLIFNSDQEPSFLDIKNKVVAELGGWHDVIVEARPVNEHQSNGVVERAVRTVA